MAASLLACGIDPARSILFQQSVVSNTQLSLTLIFFGGVVVLKENQQHRCQNMRNKPSSLRISRLLFVFMAYLYLTRQGR